MTRIIIDSLHKNGRRVLPITIYIFMGRLIVLAPATGASSGWVSMASGGWTVLHREAGFLYPGHEVLACSCYLAPLYTGGAYAIMQQFSFRSPGVTTVPEKKPAQMSVPHQRS